MNPNSTVKRLAPTSETVRRLYLLSGNQCAFPGCNHPIILDDGEYVGELCHICAAERGGERFDENQTNEERRQFDNLTLMCHAHHVLTNDVSQYTPDRMQEIKAEHEHRFAAGLASMIDSAAAIHIEQSSVSLGGEGGKAPGAGGGGGGAIGPNAKAGRGGDGGRQYWQDEEGEKVDVTNLGYPKESQEFIESIRTSLAFPPGAGGGGAGAIGSHGRAGDGGHGGDVLVGKLFLQPGVYPIRIGDGGHAAVLPGQHSFPGGETIMQDPNGNVIAHVCGGRRVRSASSYLPDGVRELTRDDVLEGVKMTLLAPTNRAEIRDGLLYLEGGGWDFLEVPMLPNDSIWNIAWTIQGNSYSEELGIYIGLLNPAGEEMACQAISVPANLRTVHFVTSIGARLDTPGLWRIIAYSGHYILAEYTVDVREPKHGGEPEPPVTRVLKA
jgi:hypothetical protein